MPVRAVAALVPVRGLAEGKRRLSPVLTPPERRALVGTMLEDVLSALRRCAVVEAVAVVTGDTEAAALAGEYGAQLLPDAPEGGLNASLGGAFAWLSATHPDSAILVVPADLPSLTPDLLDRAVLAADAAVVIARSADGGTNALLLPPPATLPPSFGPGSCERHRAAAAAAGRTVRVIDDPDLALDIDRPADLAALLSRAGSSRTLHLLHRLRLHDRLCAETPAGPVPRGSR